MEQFPLPEKSDFVSQLSDLAKQRGLNWCYASAATSLNGKLAARIKPFGGKLDKKIYRLLMNRAENIIIGGETLRKTGDWYQPMRSRMVILSASGNLPSTAPVLSQDCPVTVYSTAAEQNYNNQQLIWRQKDSWTAAEVLHDLGSGPTMIDGGGQIYTMFAPYIDDWFLTIAPVLAGEVEPSLWKSDEEELLTLATLFTHDNRLFTRWQRSQQS